MSKLFVDSRVINADAITLNASQIITIDWSLLGDRNNNSGLASFANLNRPTFTVTYANPVTTGDAIGSYTLFLVHEYTNILEVDPASRILAVKSNH